MILKNLKVPTGNIGIMKGEKGRLEFVSLHDYGKAKNIKKRWGKNGRGYTNNHDTIFSNAIMKYGWDGFKHEIITSNLSPDEAAESVHTDIRNLSNCLHGRSKTCGGFHWQFANEGGS